MKSIDAYWYSQNPLAWLLLPVSWLYCFLVLLRRQLYRAGILKSYPLAAPLVIVGNISVGGTGKTPLLIALCELLKQQGIAPGIISRGYGGNFSGERLVTTDDTPAEVGDEPCLLAQRTQCPVAIGKNRIAAAELLLKQHSCDVLLSDDGLQHYRMQRDLEIAIVDAQRRFGNGFCLPAGPLREAVSRLKDVDIVIHHGQASDENCFHLVFSDAVNLSSGKTQAVTEFKTESVHAVAGIGHPERFFTQLEHNGLVLIKHPFPDHYAYTENDLLFDGVNGSKALLMTEKDAVKCKKFAKDNYWYLPVNAELSSHLNSHLINKIKSLVHA